MKVLVTGLLQHESGKTWFTTSLIKTLRSRGVRAAVYKPVAAHSLWYQRLSLGLTKKLRVLVGEDVSTYIVYLGMTQNIAELNPVALAIALPKMENLIDYLSSLEDQFKTVVLARISNCETGIHRHYLIRTNLEHVHRSLRSLTEALAHELKAEEIELDRLVEMLTSNEISNYLSKCLEALCSRSDVVVVESFNDAIEPFRGALDLVDRVIIVAPGYALVVEDIDELRRGLKEAIAKYGVDGVRIEKVIEVAKPKLKVYELSFRLRPSDSDDAIARIAQDLGIL